jgi:alkanesulfonate monooxygenase SsuD/methylene tetrahydromethanopterin reductase-like flavin-dependent oxidoreductase (luciferase family)
MPNSGDIERVAKAIERASAIAPGMTLGDELSQRELENAARAAIAALSSLPQEDDRELVERLEMSASQSELGRNLAGTPQTCRAAANRLLQLSRDVDLLRERCAKVAEDFADSIRELPRHQQPTYTSEEMWNNVEDAGRDIADAIRALSSGISEQGEM